MKGGALADELNAAHRRELEQASATSREVISERGYRILSSEGRDDLAALGITVRSDRIFPGLLNGGGEG